MSASDALPRPVLTRKAVVHVRQSTPRQMRNNLESRRRQYDLVNVAHGHGFARVSSMNSFEERLRCSVSRSAAGFRWNEALLTQPASVDRSRSRPERA